LACIRVARVCQRQLGFLVCVYSSVANINAGLSLHGLYFMKLVKFLTDRSAMEATVTKSPSISRRGALFFAAKLILIREHISHKSGYTALSS